LLVALIASLAIGAAAASADSQVAEQASETEQSATATASPPAAGAPAAPAQAEPSAPAEPSTPAEQEPAPVAGEPAEPASPPAETEIPQDGESGPSTAPTAGQPPADSAPAQAEPAKPEPTETEPVNPEPAEPPSARATAQNQNQTWQAIFQVQQGCRSHCEGTNQSQSADQYAETIQNATAIGGGTGAPSSATALNQSATGQFIRQVQLGCVAFCYGTRQTQTADQWAQTTQNASALADGKAQAHNVGSVVQQVWQLQVGCETECYGTSQTQSWNQGQSTTQSATATSQTWGPSYPTDLSSLLPAWLVALAENMGITIQTVWQYQEADCLEYCVGDSQAQDASQRALTSQNERAVAGVPPEEHAPPMAATPPPREPAPTVATPTGASSSRSPKTFVERVTAIWRRVSGHGSSEGRIRRSSSAAALSVPGSGLTPHTRVESSARVEAGSSTAKAHTSATTRNGTTTGSDRGSADFPPVSDEPLNGLEKPDRGYSTAGWILIGLLLACGVAMLRKTHLRRPVV
jgi:hypothetical protein